MKSSRDGQELPSLSAQTVLLPQLQKFQEGTSRAADFVSIIITSCISQAFSMPSKPLLIYYFTLDINLSHFLKRNQATYEQISKESSFLVKDYYKCIQTTGAVALPSKSPSRLLTIQLGLIESRGVWGGVAETPGKSTCHICTLSTGRETAPNILDDMDKGTFPQHGS